MWYNSAVQFNWKHIEIKFYTNRQKVEKTIFSFLFFETLKPSNCRDIFWQKFSSGIIGCKVTKFHGLIKGKPLFLTYVWSGMFKLPVRFVSHIENCGLGLPVLFWDPQRANCEGVWWGYDSSNLDLNSVKYVFFYCVVYVSVMADWKLFRVCFLPNIFSEIAISSHRIWTLLWVAHTVGETAHPKVKMSSSFTLKCF